MVGTEGWMWSKMHLAKSSCSQWLTSDSESRQLENVIHIRCICTTMPIDDVDVMATRCYKYVLSERRDFTVGFSAFPLFPKARSQKPFVHLMTVRRGRAPIVVVEIACPATFMEIPTICLRLRGRSLKIWDSSLWS